MSRHNTGFNNRHRPSSRDFSEIRTSEDSNRDDITGLSDDLEGSDDSVSDDDVGASNLESYRFNWINGKVTNLQELDDGRWRTEEIDSSESWSFDGSNLIKTERGSHGTSVSSFGDPNGDGVFTANNVFSNPFSSNLNSSDGSGLGL